MDEEENKILRIIGRGKSGAKEETFVKAFAD